MPRPKAYVTPSRQGTATITEVEVGSPANVLLKLRESTSAADLSKLDKFGLEPELSQRVASFADDFNAGHAEDSLVRSLLLEKPLLFLLDKVLFLEKLEMFGVHFPALRVCGGGVARETWLPGES